MQGDKGKAVKDKTAKKKILPIKRNVIPKAALQQLRELAQFKLEISFKSAKFLHSAQDDMGRTTEVGRQGQSQGDSANHQPPTTKLNAKNQSNLTPGRFNKTLNHFR